MDLSGKSALVTGGSRGIGRAICRRLAEAGAAVAVNYHETEPGDLVREIEAAGGRALAVRADVSIKAEVEAMVAAVVAGFGGLDILVNNAGICPFHGFLDMPEELWDRVQAVNLKGTFLCSQAAARVMVEQGRGGRIIAISSISALVGGAMQTHYTPTKAGDHSLMQSLAIVLGPHGITCNSVMPGTIATDINREDLSDPAKRASVEGRIPVGRLGEPDDIAGPVVFLASEAARYVNGAGLLVDGGLFVNLQ
ncbi:MAG: L-rhamnose-1-dehydrogenase (EC [uncultured Thermomicrobiales bacterium]|uniref:L-rhamnose 1-dehydrogenase (NAD(P)(+)) n=1 Tax=uncultured Thermomicrobiales bacterium TaxID=1645740 RepID=A0A6J4VMT1_9BACT|nr:MAG: L-rhamnose-1-dehydrogenase (EC [uncultured Thermomicrobiales bacterium]